MKHLLKIAACWIAFAHPLAADNARFAPVQAQILQGWVQPDGSRVAALQLTLAPGWKTYWRAPGDAGIPPQFDWRRSRNLAGVAIDWPTPVVFDQGGMQAIGYTNHVVLPLRLMPKDKGSAVELDVTVDMGVCKDICVPEQLHLTGTLDTTDAKPQPVIVAALAEQPYSGADVGMTSATCTLRPTRKGLEITTTLTLPDAGGREVVVIEPGRDGLWVSPTDSQRKGNRLTAQADIIANDSAMLALDRSAIRITVLGRDHAVDIRGCTGG